MMLTDEDLIIVRMMNDAKITVDEVLLYCDNDLKKYSELVAMMGEGAF